MATGQLEEFGPPAATSMTSDNKHLPVWQQEVPTVALLEFYKQLAPEVQTTCEEGRTKMRKAYAEWRTVEKQTLVAIHCALAGNAEQGYFKRFCDLVEFNYQTACSIVRRAQAAEKEAKQLAEPAEQTDAAEQGTNMQMHTARSAASHPAKAKKFTDASLVKMEFTFSHDEQIRVARSLDRVIESQHCGTREAALRYVLDVFEEREAAEPTEPTTIEAVETTVASEEASA